MNNTAPVFDITLLRTFLEVVDCGGFGLAAEQLSLTPSAVSGHIKRLEVSASSLLLKRTTRSLQLTPSGHLLHAYARSIVGLEREVRARLSSPAAGRLRVGASEDFAGTWLADVLQTYKRWNPGSSIELKVGITSDLVKLLNRGRLDVVFGKQCADIGATGSLLWEEELVWAYSSDEVFDSELDLVLAMFPEPCVYRDAAITALTKAGKTWSVGFESSSMAGCLSAAKAGFAVTPIALSQLQDGLRALGGPDGLPALPQVQFYAFTRAASSVADDLIASVTSTGKRHRFSSSSRR